MHEPDRPIGANKIPLPFTELLRRATECICFEKRGSHGILPLSFFMDSCTFPSANIYDLLRMTKWE
jgi:hypothetical protein